MEDAKIERFLDLASKDALQGQTSAFFSPPCEGERNPSDANLGLLCYFLYELT